MLKILCNFLDAPKARAQRGIYTSPSSRQHHRATSMNVNEKFTTEDPWSDFNPQTTSSLLLVLLLHLPSTSKWLW